MKATRAGRMGLWGGAVRAAGAAAAAGAGRGAHEPSERASARIKLRY